LRRVCARERAVEGAGDETQTAGRARIRAPYLAAGVVVVVALVGVVWVLVGSGTTTQPTPGATGAREVRHVAEPAGPNPSASAQMACAPEAQNELASVLGATATLPAAPTWVDHLYSCRYVYPSGTMALSVKELSNRAETTAYFESLRGLLGQSEQLKGVAQGAFVTSDGSLVLRKDYKVLLVDTSGLPVPFGSGFRSRSQVAVGVGVTVLGCWTGA
jgi:hypothetical protein